MRDLPPLPTPIPQSLFTRLYGQLDTLGHEHPVYLFDRRRLRSVQERGSQGGDGRAGEDPGRAVDLEGLF